MFINGIILLMYVYIRVEIKEITYLPNNVPISLIYRIAFCPAVVSIKRIVEWTVPGECYSKGC